MNSHVGLSQNSFETFNRSFTNINVENGLANNLVYSMAQDSIGFMWMATADGLCRYGGNDFKVFRHDINNPNSIISNNLNDIFYESSQNRIWISTSLGLDFLDLETLQFSHLDAIGELSLNTRSIGIAQNSKGDIAVAYSDNSLVVYNQQDYTYHKLPDVNNSEAQYIAFLGDTAICLSQLHSEVFIYDLQTKVTERVTIGEDISLNRFSTYFGQLSVATNAGIFIFNPSTRKFIPSGNAYLDNADIVASHLDRESHLWVGTRDQGIAISKEPIDSFESGSGFDYYTPRTDGSSVYSKTIQSFFEDRDGAIWMGTWSSGINYTAPKKSSVRLIDQNPASKIHLSHKRVWGLDYGGGQLWVGTDGGGLNSIDLKTGEVNFDVLDQYGLSDNKAILSLHYAENEVLWVGTYKGGLLKIDLKNGEKTVFKRSRESQNALDKNDVRLIFEDSKKRLFVGANGGGLKILDRQTNEFLSIDKFRGMDIRSICEDTDGGYWVASYGERLFYYQPDERNFITIDERIIRELKGNKISDLRIKSHQLFIGTRYSGLIKYNTLDSSYVVYGESEGLINNSIRAFEFDNSDELWISTDRGLSVFNTEEEVFENFGTSYNIQKGEFNVGSVLKLPNGMIAFGGTWGLNIVDPDGLKANSSYQKLLISDITVLGKPITEILGNKSPIFSSEEIVLPYNQNVLTFNFEVLAYPVAAKQRLNYTLEGSDMQWNLSYGSDAITYGNLSPGTYNFRVSKTNAGNSSDLIYQTLTIDPPLWLSKLAFVLYAALSLVIMLVVIRYYTTQIKLRSSLVFEKKIRFQEHKLNQERIRFFTNFSHELRTPLTLIIGPLKSLIAKASNEEVRDGMKLIQRNALSLTNLINKMLEFRKAEVGHFTLQVSNYDIVEILDTIVGNYRDLAKFRGVTLSFAKPEKKVELWIDAEKLEIVMNNLFSNAFKYTPRGGSITVNLHDQEDKVTISVKDTGSGIPKSSLKTIFQWYYQANDSKSVSGTGIGLALTQKIVELHRGKIRVRSVIKEGADFYFTLPKGKDHLGQMQFVEARSLGLELPEYNVPTKEIGESDQLVDPNDRRERILIVDDNNDITLYLKQVLSRDYMVYVADDGEKGISLALEEIPDLIISDVMMPAKTGIDLCKELKNDSRTSHIPIILLTAKHSSEDTILGYSEGADSYMIKPFDEDVLTTRVSNLLKSRVLLKSYFGDHHEQPETEASPQDERTQVELEFLEKVESIIFKESLEKGKEVGVYDLARELGFSRASLYRKLKSVTGCSINEFLRKVKLKKAEELISTGQMNVSEAAFFVGFSDVKYFRSIFKKEFGRLPSDVKKDAPERLL